jgi:hypothetical protein
MTGRVRRERRVILLVSTIWACTAAAGYAQSADAQSPPAATLAEVAARVPPGDVVYVTDASGATIKGTLAEATGEAVRVSVKSGVRRVAAADVRRVQWQRRDSVFDGMLIGAAIGAIPGVYYLIADPNECTGFCAEDYAAIATGAAVGALVDRAVKRRLTVYTGRSGVGAKRVTIAPLMTRSRRGVRLTVGF